MTQCSSIWGVVNMLWAGFSICPVQWWRNRQTLRNNPCLQGKPEGTYGKLAMRYLKNSCLNLELELFQLYYCLQFTKLYFNRIDFGQLKPCETVLNFDSGVTVFPRGSSWMTAGLLRRRGWRVFWAALTIALFGLSAQNMQSGYKGDTVNEQGQPLKMT